jgi:hypothetical protein
MADIGIFALLICRYLGIVMREIVGFATMF